MITTMRCDNDKNNKIRENVLLILHDPPAIYMTDPIYGDTWKNMSSKWNAFLATLCEVNYDSIRVKKMAGRKYNYDHEITFLNQDVPVQVLKTEFKHNATSIDNLPEYFNSPEKKRYIEKCYAEYFYDNYIDRVCSLSDRLVKPSKDIYMNCIYSANYSKNKFFETLKEIEPTIHNEKKAIVHESIKNYLDAYGNTIDLKTLTSEIKKTQSGKIFILWDLENFKVDRFLEDEFELERVIKIKNNNVIVVQSKHGTIHNLLLRWKNHLGILFPAWQISLERLVKHARFRI
jgi:hypothetical protein